MKNLLTTLAAGSTVSILFSCATLPDIDKSICGDGVLQVGEDCDPLATASLETWASTPDKPAFGTCGQPNDEGACRYVAPPRDTCPKTSPKGCSSDCPVGWGLSVGGVCVRPDNGFTQKGLVVEPSARTFRAGDFDGDGLSDLAFVTAGRLHAMYGDTNSPFETERTLSKAIQAAQPPTNSLDIAKDPFLSIGDVSEDGADDVILVAPGIGGRDENSRLSVNSGFDNTFLPSVLPTFRIDELVGDIEKAIKELKDAAPPVPSRLQKLLRLEGTFSTATKKVEQGVGVFVLAPDLQMPLLRSAFVPFGYVPSEDLKPLDVSYLLSAGVQTMRLTAPSPCEIAFIASKAANAVIVPHLPSCPESPLTLKKFDLPVGSNVEALTVYDYDRDGRNDLIAKVTVANKVSVVWLKARGSADTLAFDPPVRADRFFDNNAMPDPTPHMPFAVIEDAVDGSALFIEKETDVRLWRRDAAGSFENILKVDRGNTALIKVDNFDGEGPPDAWIVQGSTAVFVKVKSMSDVKAVSYALSSTAIQLAAGDLDGDSIADLVLRSGDSDVSADSIRLASNLFFFYGRRFGFPEDPVLAGTIADVDDILVAPRSVQLSAGPNISGDLVYAIGRTTNDTSLQTLISVSGTRVVSSEYTSGSLFSTSTYADFGGRSVVAFNDNPNENFSVLRFQGGVLTSVETPGEVAIETSAQCTGPKTVQNAISASIQPDGVTTIAARLRLPTASCPGGLFLVENRDKKWSQRFSPTDQVFRTEGAPPRMRVGDIDGDGYKDLVLLYNGTDNKRVLEVRRGKAGGLEEPQRTVLDVAYVDVETIQRRESAARDLVFASDLSLTFFGWKGGGLTKLDTLEVRPVASRGGAVRAISEIVNGDVDGDGHEDISALVVSRNARGANQLGAQIVLLRGGKNEN